MHIDINCDLGEGKNIDDGTRDTRLMPFISRCSIACGGHAGNAGTMARTVDNAMRHNLAIGAHPGYPDRDHFGRKSLAISRPQLLESISNQIGVLSVITRQAGVTLDHVKLHGALYNDAEADPDLACAIVSHLNQLFPRLKILGLANAAMETAALDAGIPFIREGFMDRRYLNNHQLVPRAQTGAMLEEFSQCLQQTMCLIRGETFPALDGTPLAMSVDSICLHGDNPQAEHIASRLYRSLIEADIRIRA